MVDISSGNTLRTGVYNHLTPTANAIDSGKPRFKVGYVTLGATADDTDTTTFDMYEKFGMQRLLGVEGYIQTTANSVIVAEAPTTAVDGTNVTLTVGGSTDNKQRTYIIYGI